MSLIPKLTKRGLISPPAWLPHNIHYLTITGSQATGVTSDDSDWDLYGWAIPPKEDIFPHLRGEILDFGTQKQRFEQWEQHHITDNNAGKQYDFTVYSIVKFFQLCMDNNPNMLHALWTPQNCVLHSTQLGQRVRDSRRMFLHRGCYHRYRGYAYSQLHKIRSKEPVEGRRKELVDRYGYDVKFAYHLVRLLGEVEQILTEGDCDIQRDRERLKEIRRGGWTIDRIESFFEQKEKQLEVAYHESPLPWGPDEEAIKTLLIECLETHFGDLSTAVTLGNHADRALQEIYDITTQALHRRQS